MDQKQLPRRKSKKPRIALFCLLGAALAALTIFAIWKSETIWFVFHPDGITVSDAGTAERGLRDGPFSITSESDGQIFYTALDNSFRMSMSHENGRVTAMTADFNIFRIPIGSVPEAIDKGKTLLMPYLSSPETEALAFLIAGEIMAYISNERVTYSRSIGEYRMTIGGNIREGSMSVLLALK